MAKRIKAAPKPTQADLLTEPLRDTAIDCADANAATEAYREARDAGAGEVEFTGVWSDHPTWTTAVSDGIWTVQIEPPNGPPGGRGRLVRIAAID